MVARMLFVRRMLRIIENRNGSFHGMPQNRKDRARIPHIKEILPGLEQVSGNHDLGQAGFRKTEAVGVLHAVELGGVHVDKLGVVGFFEDIEGIFALVAAADLGRSDESEAAGQEILDRCPTGFWNVPEYGACYFGNINKVISNIIVGCTCSTLLRT